MSLKHSLIAFLLAVVLLGGCSEKSVTTPPKPSSEQYYVVSVEKNRFLGVLTESYQGYAPNTDKEYYAAIYYEYPNASDLRVGQRVKVKSNHPVMESDPGQSIADNVEVLPEYKPKDANMSEFEVVAKAMKITKKQSKEIDPKVVGIKSINYNDKSDIWKVITNLDGKIFDLEIKDR